MNNRPRVCAAVIQEGKILMVRHTLPERSFLTLPGGGVEQGETYESAVSRELKEETGLTGIVERLLFEDIYEFGSVYCYLVSVHLGQEAMLGFDPELPVNEQILQEVEWVSLESMKNDYTCFTKSKSRNDNSIIQGESCDRLYQLSGDGSKKENNEAAANMYGNLCWSNGKLGRWL